MLVEYDKLIDRQLERAAITTISGYAKIFPLRTKQGKKVGVCVVHDLKDLIFCNITVSKNQSIRSGQLVVLVDLLLILLAQLLPDPFSSVTS